MSVDRLSPQQFQNLANIMAGDKKPDEEGFSVKAFGSNAGERATNAYMVGTGGVDFPNSNPTASEIEDVANANETALRRHDMYLGGWGGQEPVRASLDVAQAFTRGSKMSQVETLRTAARFNQEAIGVVDNSGNYAGEVKNPHYVAGAPQTGQLLTPKMRDWSESPINKRPTKKTSKKTKTLPTRNPLANL